MQDSTFSVTFWGVRGGYPKPGPHTAKYGGNTTCIEIRAGDHLIIIDAGTGIIDLGEKLVAEQVASGQPIVSTLLFTHTHHDHTQGFPFFVPSHLGSSVLYMFGPKLFHHDLETALTRAMLPPVFPVSLDELGSMRVIRNTAEADVIILGDRDAPPKVCNVFRDAGGFEPGQVRVRALRSYAHPQGVFIYRVEMDTKKVVIATDVEGYTGGDQRLIEFARGADILIHDAEFTQEEYLEGAPARQGWGHSTWEMAVEVAEAAEAKRLLLTHHNARHGDTLLAEMERQAQAAFPAATMACEGLTLEV